MLELPYNFCCCVNGLTCSQTSFGPNLPLLCNSPGISFIKAYTTCNNLLMVTKKALDSWMNVILKNIFISNFEQVFTH